MHWTVIGCYEPVEIKPSNGMAAQIAEAIEVSFDYLAGNTDLIPGKTIIKRILDIQKLDEKNRKHLFAMMNAFLGDFKAKQAYAS